MCLIDSNPKDKPLIYVLSLGMNLWHLLTCFYEFTALELFLGKGWLQTPKWRVFDMFKVPKLFLDDSRIYSKAIGGVIWLLNM